MVSTNPNLVGQMPVLSREEIMQRLVTSIERMQRVRRRAQLEAIIRAGGEPAPSSAPGELGEPGPEFRGEPPRPGSPTG